MTRAVTVRAEHRGPIAVGAAVPLIALAVAVGTAGCGQQAAPGPAVSLGLVLGERSNSVAVPWTAVQPLLPQTATAGTRVVVVGVDGSPNGKALFDGRVGQHSYSGDSADDLARLRAGVHRAVDSAVAAQPEADPLGAIATVARSLTAGPVPCSIVVDDSLVATAGPLDLRGGSLLRADAADVAQALADRGELPDLQRCTLDLRGAGQVTAPQPALDEHQQRQLRALWTAVLTKAGARSLLWDDALSPAAPRTGLPPVTPVLFPAAPPIVLPADPCSAVLDNTTVAFEPNTAVFLDEDAARTAVATVAHHLAACPGKTTLTGTTAAWGSVESRNQLAVERASAVRQLLAAATGTDPSSMTIVGAGSDFPQYVNDHDSAGHLVPELAARNRTVRITVTP